MHNLVDLDGVNIARGQCDGDSTNLTICAASGFEAKTGYFPAESITLNSIEAVKALSELCALMITRHTELFPDL